MSAPDELVHEHLERSIAQIANTVGLSEARVRLVIARLIDPRLRTPVPPGPLVAAGQLDYVPHVTSSPRRDNATAARPLAEHPVAVEWHPSRNGHLTPDLLPTTSAKKVWWRCLQGHEWIAMVHERIRRCSGCPACWREWSVSSWNLAIIRDGLDEFAASVTTAADLSQLEVYGLLLERLGHDLAQPNRRTPAPPRSKRPDPELTSYVRLTRPQRRTIVSLVTSGWPLMDVARHLDVTYDAVRRAALDAGIRSWPVSRWKGNEILARHQQGHSVAEIAQDLTLKLGTVEQVIEIGPQPGS